MKYIISFCLIVFGFTNLYAQRNKDDTTVYRFDSVQVKPKFPGDLNKYLVDNIISPEAPRDSNITGTVYISFVVEKDGSISNIKPLRYPKGGGSYAKELMKVITKMPKWQPAIKNSHQVRCVYMTSLFFEVR